MIPDKKYLTGIGQSGIFFDLHGRNSLGIFCYSVFFITFAITILVHESGHSTFIFFSDTVI